VSRRDFRRWILLPVRRGASIRIADGRDSVIGNTIANAHGLAEEIAAVTSGEDFDLKDPINRGFSRIPRIEF
jgi:hypothetical protein